ncbi:hypothetical protein AQUCO_01300521v1 [Aquilegia coerulea]|uniref:Peptidase M48 domain-containing protein n=1 Tax=Aquilegia coerulea TaxID=218851 RepID=A0A2G5E230_AQUCA|nr:hypothetical protein AQUCO_01300521v1 [Aquilegia coerulea]
MSYYRRAKLAIDSFRSFTSKVINQTTDSRVSIQNAIHSGKITNTRNSTRALSTRVSVSSLINSVSRKPNFEIGRRYYYVDRRRVQHFKPRGPERWFQSPRNMLVVVIVSGGVMISVYFGNIETIPYTKRRHFVLLSTGMEKQLGESEFEKIKKSFHGKILPAIHPESIRVRLIAKDIIQAVQRGVKQETVWSDPDYASQSSGASEESALETVKALMGDGEENPDASWRREEEVLDDKWIDKSRKKAHEKGLKSATRHLDGLNWEVLVVDEPVVNAFCLPGGKIVVFTGLLQHFRTDAEVATIIGHEVAHAVARHSAEGLTKNMWLGIIQIVLLQFVSMPDLVNAMSNLLLRLPFSRRMEMEADYIGLLLVASAGHDPRIAPQVYEKLDKISGESALKDYLSTHPSGKKRARLLAQAHVMEEALAIYKEARAGRRVVDFL